MKFYYTLLFIHYIQLVYFNLYITSIYKLQYINFWTVYHYNGGLLKDHYSLPSFSQKRISFSFNTLHFLVFIDIYLIYLFYLG